MQKEVCTFISSPVNKFSFGYDFSSYKCVGLKLQLVHYISDMYRAGVREFYSVCEEGVDLWAAEIVLCIMKNDPKTKLHCVIPYEEQAAKWHESTRELYYYVLEHATDVSFISRRYQKGCLAAARYAVLDKCKMVFASIVEGEDDEFFRYSCAAGKDVFSVICA